MKREVLLSICIPTNGILEWVVPVIESIYKQNVDEKKFEVIITDNGTNNEFFDKMKMYEYNHKNLRYKRTNAVQFLNQIEAFNMARGEFIKFLNHRMILLPGALEYFLEFVQSNMNEKPVTYFTNGVINQESKSLKSFDEYVHILSYWSSWSAGTAMWKEHFDALNINNYNNLFPHTDLIFAIKDSSSYVIDNKRLMEELPTDNYKKGNYNLFYAFAVEYPAIIFDLYRNENITIDTFNSVIEDNKKFVGQLYYAYIIRKKSCSYSLECYEKYIKIFYSKKHMYREAVKIIIKRILKLK